jgi:hypothetical protein
MDDQTYNGWKNYPTWAVNLWLANDEGLYHEAVERVSAWRAVTESPRVAIADEFKNWVTEDLAPDLGASFAADLLGWALDQVDWFELADAWLESVGEAV